MNRDELEVIRHERDGLRHQLKELTEQYVATSNILRESQSGVPKGAATVMQVQKNKELLNETSTVLESAQQNLQTASSGRTNASEPETLPPAALSHAAVGEVERQCNFLRRTMRESASPSAASMLQVFGTPEALGELVRERDYESLLVLALKAMSVTLVGERVPLQGKVRPEELAVSRRRSPSPLKKKDEPASAGKMKSSIAEYVGTESKVRDSGPSATRESPETRAILASPQPAQTAAEPAQENPDTKRGTSPGRGVLVDTPGDRNQPGAFLRRDGSRRFEKWLRVYTDPAAGPKPVFNNYTKKTADFFDPLFQFGGESVYPSLDLKEPID